MGALSQLPSSPLRIITTMMSVTCAHKIWTCFELKDALLDDTKQGFNTDPFTEKLTSPSVEMLNIQQQDGLWFVGDQLLIPGTPNT